MNAPATGRAVFDLDQAAAAAAAAQEATPFPFTYRGATYEVPPALNWPLQAQALIGRGELADAMVLLLGQATFDQLCAAGMTMGELNVLFEEVGRAAGVGGLPNSPPPAPPGSTAT
jgi:hypothetical protein